MNILFICTGNTCRSPMAEGIMNKIAEDNDMDVHCKSAGLYAEAGAGASEEAIQAAQNIGVDISAHKAQNVSEELIKNSDLILTMTNSHKAMLSLSSLDKPVYTLCEYAGTSGDISDPYGGDFEDYDEVCHQIYDIMLDVAERVYDEYCKDGEE